MVLAEEYFAFRSALAQKGILLSYTGLVSEKVLFALGEALKVKMAVEETDANLTKRVFSVFVEQVQNIIRYSAERLENGAPPQELSAGMITVGSEDRRFFVVCGNVVRDSDVGHLRKRLEHLAGLDKEALKAYYREKLKEPPEEQSRGATLGLIEIARRSTGPLQYDFHDIQDGRSFFCLKAYI